jgi:uncharacterized protein (DUF58 family)
VNPETAALAHRQALAAMKRFRLPLRTQSWRGAAGEFAGNGVGSSLDFQDQRNYVAGDDPRHINWQAYARTGQYTMKLYREEVRPLVDVIFDVSGSMLFDEKKALRSAELFCLVAESARSHGASSLLYLSSGSELRLISYDSLAGADWVNEARKITQTQQQAVIPDLSRIPLRGNSLRILISDLLYPGEPEPLFLKLKSGHSNAIVLAPYCAAEEKPEWSGNYEFIDTESSLKQTHRIDPAVLRRYEESYRQHFTLWKTTAVRHQCRLARVSADLSLTSSLSAEAIHSGALEFCP